MNDASVLATFPALSADGGGHAYRIYRGGAWNDCHPISLLCANRMGDGFAFPEKRYDNLGFRCILASRSAWTNSLGQVFVPVSGTKVLFCIWETRVQDFEAFVDATGYDATGGTWSLGADRQYRARVILGGVRGFCKGRRIQCAPSIGTMQRHFARG